VDKYFIDFMAKNVHSFPGRLEIKYLKNFPLEHERRNTGHRGRLFEPN